MQALPIPFLRHIRPPPPRTLAGLRRENPLFRGRGIDIAPKPARSNGSFSYPSGLRRETGRIKLESLRDGGIASNAVESQFVEWVFVFPEREIMRLFFRALSVFALSFAAFVHGQDEKVVMATSGYQIKVLDPGLAETVPFEAFKFLLPHKQGFASSVNVQHQPFPGTMEEFAKLSVGQFEAGKFKLINSKVEGDVFTAEATGNVATLKMDMHFYFKAIKRGNNVILATATIPASRWDAESPKLIPIVDSLEPKP